MDLLLKLFQIERVSEARAELWFDTVMPVALVMLLGLLGLLATLLPLATLRGVSGMRQGALAGLRILAVGLLLVLLFKPAVVLLSPIEEKERLGVLLDASRSMSVAETPGGPSRWQQALESLEEGVLHRLGERYDLELYAFGADLAAVGSREGLAAVGPQDEETDLGEALAQLQREGRDLTLGGLVVVSDGIDRGALRRAWLEGGDEALRRGISGLELPIFVLPSDPQRSFMDLSIDELRTNEFAFLRQPFKVEVGVRSQGLAGLATSIRLTSGGRVLGTQPIVMPADDQTLKVAFAVNPDKVGKFTYTLEIPVHPGEAVAENNRRSFTQKVVRDKTRVLQVAGAPSWDVKFLRRLLKSDPNIDLVSFFILRGMGDYNNYGRDELSLIEFPYQDLFDLEKDLASFDVVVFQNFAYRPYLREESYRLLSSLADFVRGGGGLAMLGGESAFGAGEYANTPLEAVLPVVMDRVPSVAAQPVALQITAQGLRHPVSSLHFDPEVNRKLWGALPPLDGFNPTSAAPGAVVLATVADESELPLLAVREAGRGRTLALTSDTSWYWSFVAVGEGQSNLSYLRFWKNSLRWLVGDPDEQQLQVDTERENYRLGEQTLIEVRLMGADYEPQPGVKVALEIGLEDGSSQPTKLEAETGAAGELLHRFRAERAGPYRIRAVVEGRVNGVAETVFTVSEEGPEMKSLAADHRFLEALARVSGGRVLEAQTAAGLELRTRREGGLVQRAVMPLWDRFPPYLALLALICVEWLLRRRWALR